MSILGSILELIKFPGSGAPRGELDGRNSQWNGDHNGGDDNSKGGDKDEYSKHGEDDYLKRARNDDGQTHKDYSQPQQDHYVPTPSDDGGKGDTYGNPGEALAKFDFSNGEVGSNGEFGSHGADHSGDMLGALASMSSDDALEYAITQMGPADHFDAGHFDAPADAPHDTDA
jgi:hypothetical protein